MAASLRKKADLAKRVAFKATLRGIFALLRLYGVWDGVWGAVFGAGVGGARCSISNCVNQRSLKVGYYDRKCQFSFSQSQMTITPVS